MTMLFHGHFAFRSVAQEPPITERDGQLQQSRTNTKLIIFHQNVYRLFLALTLLTFAVICSGCGPRNQPQPVVIAEVQEENSKPALVERILDDEKRAAKIIRDTIAEEGELAPLAAVYARRLGIRHDQNAALKSLTIGILSNNSLLAALCWRWIAVSDPAPCKSLEALPEPPTDPVIATLATFAYGRCGPIPEELTDSLGLPGGSPQPHKTRDEFQQRTDSLIALAAPFDNGPLAITLAFFEAQRNEWGESVENDKTRFVAERLRDELFRQLLPSDRALVERLRRSPTPTSVGLSSVSQYLETPLVNQNRNALHGAVLKGHTSLKVAALRAIAIVSRKPIAEDFGAAASCLEAEDLQLRLEAARTFLLLTKRSR